MKKLVLVYNPVSGHATFKNKLDYIIEQFQRRDCMLVVYRTQRDNRDLADFIRMSGAEGILAAGGDGTLHEVVNILMREKIHLPVAIIGSGTSNDFAYSLGVSENLDAYFDHIATGRTRDVDLGLVGNEYFVNVASAGMLTGIAHEVDARFKNSMGKMAYYLRGLGEIPHFRSLSLHIEADGEALDEKAFFFIVANSRTVASFKNAVPTAQVDDGRLDLLLIRQCSVPEFMALAAELVSGRSIIHKKNVYYRQASSIFVSAATDVESDLDGERGPDLPLHIQTVPKAIKMFY